VNEQRPTEARGERNCRKNTKWPDVQDRAWRKHDRGHDRKKSPEHDEQLAFKMASPIMKAWNLNFANRNRIADRFLCDRHPEQHVQVPTSTVSHFLDCAERRSRPSRSISLPRIQTPCHWIQGGNGAGCHHVMCWIVTHSLILDFTPPNRSTSTNNTSASNAAYRSCSSASGRRVQSDVCSDLSRATPSSRSHTIASE